MNTKGRGTPTAWFGLAGMMIERCPLVTLDHTRIRGKDGTPAPVSRGRNPLPDADAAGNADRGEPPVAIGTLAASEREELFLDALSDGSA